MSNCVSKSRSRLVKLARIGIVESAYRDGYSDIQRIDCPESFKDCWALDFVPPFLNSDREAKRIYYNIGKVAPKVSENIKKELYRLVGSISKYIVSDFEKEFSNETQENLDNVFIEYIEKEVRAKKCRSVEREGDLEWRFFYSRLKKVLGEDVADSICSYITKGKTKPEENVKALETIYIALNHNKY